MTTPNRVLLLGAGFSRNWGGWLANELTEYLIGRRELDQYSRDLLIKHRSVGFEGALDLLQRDKAQQLKSFETAVMSAFDSMNNAYTNLPFEFCNDGAFSVQKFLTQFDVIFSLNQDTLLETHYLNDNVSLLSRRWNGYDIPGMRAEPKSHPLDPKPAIYKPYESPAIQQGSQPYIKLHGSSNWRSDNGNLLIIGGNKSSAIANEPVLAWGVRNFDKYLSRPETRLMVIGYGFRDDHINRVIVDRAKKGQMQLFVIDPQGMDVVNWRMQGAQIPADSDIAKDLWPVMRGASRRPLSSTFGGSDRAELEKLLYFLQ